MRKILLCVFLLVSFAGCNNLEDATPSDRDTFIKFFNGPHDLTGTSLEIIPGGYIILGNLQVNDTLVKTVVIQTDDNGNRVGDFNYYEGGTGNAIKPLMNSGAVTGYVIIGDSIKVDPFADQAGNIIISSLRILRLDENFGDPVDSYYKTDRRPITGAHPFKQDFSGQSLTITEDGRIFALGSVSEGQQAAPKKTLLIELDPALDSLWSNEYDINDRTYQNSKTVIYNNTKIIWASALSIEQGGFNNSYVSIPVAEEQSTFVNFSVIGQTTEQLFVPSDITPSSNVAFGYGVVGTYSEETNGSKGNLFFLRVNQAGDIVPESVQFFDGLTGIEPLTDLTVSNTLDGGETITSTTDGGFVVAGTTILSSGEGKDIWLIKLNALGNPVWTKTLGGSGDQVPSAIRELPSGELLICGTNTVGGFSSIFLIKTDKNGELNK